MRPSPALPASAVYIQSVSGLSCSDGHAAGINSAAGGGPPASTSATRHVGSSESRAAMTAPADPPPTTTKSNSCAMNRNLLRMRLNGIREFVANGEHGTRIVGPSPLTNRGRGLIARISSSTSAQRRVLQAIECRPAPHRRGRRRGAVGLDDGAIRTNCGGHALVVTPKTESVVPLSCQYGR